MKIKIKEIKANIASDYRYTTVMLSISFIMPKIFIYKNYINMTQEDNLNQRNHKRVLHPSISMTPLQHCIL